MSNLRPVAVQSIARIAPKNAKRPVKGAKTMRSISKNGSSSHQSNDAKTKDNPWLRFAGSLKGDPDVKEVERIIAKQGDKWVPV